MASRRHVVELGGELGGYLIHLLAFLCSSGLKNFHDYCRACSLMPKNSGPVRVIINPCVVLC